MKEVQLTRGMLTLVDDEDYEWVSKYRWHYVANRTGYAARTIKRQGQHKKIYLHREIVHATDGMEVDHINGNSIDNRRSNLRVATRTENARNMPKSKAGKVHARFKGVAKNKGKTWRARITVSGKSLYLGSFSTAELAARAYDAAARKYFGDFAHLNFSEEVNRD